jgi:7,8-dihydropterin-6-yl-methyl-4-(beta-D-ribofuranosyl)aminobenzene 5'-phosphate synthase
VFVRNAEVLGVDLSDVNYVFISHGHNDHTGGLRYFLECNQRARIIISPDAISGKFYSKRGNLHSITTAWPEEIKDRLITVEKTSEIADGLYVIAHIPQIYSMPKGNQNLFVQDEKGNYVPDDFRHELALYADGLLFTGCAHNGLENILAACPWQVHTVVGGFHLLDSHELPEQQEPSRDGSRRSQSEEELLALAQRLKDQYPLTQFYTSHCTGDRVFEIMKGVMGEQLHSFRCGIIIEH